jgi:hypothetical protein
VADQLVYTRSRSGLSDSPGFQIRAASSGLLKGSARRLAFLRQVCEAPVPKASGEAYGYVDFGSGLHLGYRRGRVPIEFAGRAGVFIVHLVVFDEGELQPSLWMATRFDSPWWHEVEATLHQRDGDPSSVELPRVDLSAIPPSGKVTSLQTSDLSPNAKYVASLVAVQADAIVGSQAIELCQGVHFASRIPLASDVNPTFLWQGPANFRVALRALPHESHISLDSQLQRLASLDGSQIEAGLVAASYAIRAGLSAEDSVQLGLLASSGSREWAGEGRVLENLFRSPEAATYLLDSPDLTEACLESALDAGYPIALSSLPGRANELMRTWLADDSFHPSTARANNFVRLVVQIQDFELFLLCLKSGMVSSEHVADAIKGCDPGFSELLLARVAIERPELLVQVLESRANTPEVRSRAVVSLICAGRLISADWARVLDISWDVVTVLERTWMTSRARRQLLLAAAEPPSNVDIFCAILSQSEEFLPAQAIAEASIRALGMVRGFADLEALVVAASRALTPERSRSGDADEFACLTARWLFDATSGDESSLIRVAEILRVSIQTSSVRVRQRSLIESLQAFAIPTCPETNFLLGLYFLTESASDHELTTRSSPRLLGGYYYDQYMNWIVILVWRTWFRAGGAKPSTGSFRYLRKARLQAPALLTWSLIERAAWTVDDRMKSTRSILDWLAEDLLPRASHQVRGVIADTLYVCERVSTHDERKAFQATRRAISK